MSISGMTATPWFAHVRCMFRKSCFVQLSFFLGTRPSRVEPVGGWKRKAAYRFFHPSLPSPYRNAGFQRLSDACRCILLILKKDAYTQMSPASDKSSVLPDSSQLMVPFTQEGGIKPMSSCVQHKASNLPAGGVRPLPSRKGRIEKLGSHSPRLWSARCRAYIAVMGLELGRWWVYRR